jgi:hypothetical protein
MFEWLWGRGSARRANPRKKPAPMRSRTVSAWSEPARPAQRFAEVPAALPEVISEGNSQADWSAWEDSMTSLDSQLQQTSPATRVHVSAPRKQGPAQAKPERKP